MAGSGRAACNAKEVEMPSVPLAPVDCGNTRYSAESVVEAFAANVTQPESAVGSSETKPATARESCVPCAPQDGRAPGPDESLHAIVEARPTKKVGAHKRVFTATFG